MPDAKLNPLRLPPSDAARLLSKAGGQPVTEEQVRQAIAAGAPVGADGNLNLIHLSAWLVKAIGDAGK